MSVAHGLNPTSYDTRGASNIIVCKLELIHGLNVVIVEGNPHDLSALLLAGRDSDLDQGGGAPQGQALDAEADGWEALLLLSDQDPVNDLDLARLRDESPKKIIIVGSNYGLHSLGEGHHISFSQTPEMLTNFMIC